jgi:hypothetical protein
MTYFIETYRSETLTSKIQHTNIWKTFLIISHFANIDDILYHQYNTH